MLYPLAVFLLALNMIRISGIIILVCYGIMPAAQQLPLDTYTPANGLVDTRVTQMYQDSKGRLYFLTREGFSIFDGQHFDNYANGQNGPSQIMSGIAEYSNGLVRLFTFGGIIYNVKGSHVTVDTTKTALLKEINVVHRIGTDDHLIVTNYAILREKNHQLIALKKSYTDFLNLAVVSSLISKPHILLSFSNFNSINKLVLYNYETQQLVDSLPGIYFHCQAKDNDQNIYILTDRILQLNNAALEQGKIKLAEPSFTRIIPPSFKTAKPFFDSENNLWLANGKEFCKINQATQKLTIYNSGNGILSAGALYFQDAEKNDWLISGSYGVQKLQHTPLSKISTIANRDLEYVLHVNVDEKGNRLIETPTAFFLNDKLISSVNKSAARNYYAHNRHWWFADYKTLKGSNGITFNINEYVTSYNAENFQPGYISFDNEGRILIAGAILFLIDKDLKFYAYKPGYYFDNAVTDNQNNYWLFLRSDEVNRVSRKNGRLELVFKKMIPNLNPRAALQWDDSTFFIGTRNEGIKIFKWNKKDLIETAVINKGHGLSNNFVYYLLKKNNQLIAGTGTGMDRILLQAKDTIIENLAVRNNIFSPFHFLCLQRDSSVLALTGSGELYQLKDDTVLSKSFLPSPFFRNIKVNNEETDTLHSFSHNKNNFLFSVSAPSFRDNKNIKYAFSLTGNGQHWEQHATSADFDIVNLQPGSYEMKVTVHYPGKFYSDQVLTYSFTINKPFWKQWWFILLVVLIIGLTGFYLISSYYRRRLEKQKMTAEKQQAVDRERNRMARELHDGLGGMLSGIKHTLTALKNDITLSDEHGAVYNKSVDKLNDSINEIRNLSHQMASEGVLRHGFENTVKDYCRFVSNAHKLEIIFEALHTGQMRLTESRAFHLFRIIQEFLQNTIKHAAAKHAIVQLNYNNKKLLLTLEDNGKGFDINDAKNKGLGIKNIYERAEMLNAKLNFKAIPGTGTYLIIELHCEEK